MEPTNRSHPIGRRLLPPQHTRTHRNALHCNTHYQTLQHSANGNTQRNTWCNTQQHAAAHTATHCNTLQHTATHCNTHCNTLQHTATCYVHLPYQGWCPGRNLLLGPYKVQSTLQNTPQHAATHCNTTHAKYSVPDLMLWKQACIWGLQEVRSTLQRKLQHTATHCNTLQHTATHCNTVCTRSSALGMGLHLEILGGTKHTATHTATHCDTLQHTTTHCNTLQHTATPCNTLQQGL